jgi:hypothetical protein
MTSKIFYTCSSVAYEAPAREMRQKFVQFWTDLHLDQLEPFADLRWTARTAA